MSVEPIAISAVPNAHTAVSSFAAVSGSETPSRSTKTSFEEGSTAKVWSATARRPALYLGLVAREPRAQSPLGLGVGGDTPVRTGSRKAEPSPDQFA